MFRIWYIDLEFWIFYFQNSILKNVFKIQCILYFVFWTEKWVYCEYFLLWCNIYYFQQNILKIHFLLALLSLTLAIGIFQAANTLYIYCMFLCSLWNWSLVVAILGRLAFTKLKLKVFYENMYVFEISKMELCEWIFGLRLELEIRNVCRIKCNSWISFGIIICVQHFSISI